MAFCLLSIFLPDGIFSPSTTPTDLPPTARKKREWGNETDGDDPMAKYEPTSFEVVKSYKNAANTALARAVFPLNTWTSYDRCQAHTWALRLIHENPQTGADVAAALVNYDYMQQPARNHYETRARDQKRCDAILAVYLKWKSEVEIGAAA